MVKQQRGVALLLTCATLLLVTSQLLITAHQTAYFEVYRISNELESRQKFWLVNGVLECALSHLNTSTHQPTTDINFDHCEKNGVKLEVITVDRQYQMTGEIEGGSSMTLYSYPVEMAGREHWIRGGWRDFF